MLARTYSIISNENIVFDLAHFLREHNWPLGYRIKFQLPFNNIKWLSDYSRRWQLKG